MKAVNKDTCEQYFFNIYSSIILPQTKVNYEYSVINYFNRTYNLCYNLNLSKLYITYTYMCYVVISSVIFCSCQCALYGGRAFFFKTLILCARPFLIFLTRLVCHAVFGGLSCFFNTLIPCFGLLFNILVHDFAKCVLLVENIKNGGINKL